MLIKRLYLDQSGIEVFLGPTETLMLRTVWQLVAEGRSPTVKHVLQELARENYIYALATVATTLNRLSTKKLLRRSHFGLHGPNAIKYYPQFDSEQDVIDCYVSQIITKLKEEEMI